MYCTHCYLLISSIHVQPWLLADCSFWDGLNFKNRENSSVLYGVHPEVLITCTFILRYMYIYICAL